MAIQTPASPHTVQKRVLSPASPEADLVAAASAAQAVGATTIAAPLTELVREKALARQRARKLANVYAAVSDDQAF